MVVELLAEHLPEDVAQLLGIVVVVGDEADEFLDCGYNTKQDTFEQLGEQLFDDEDGVYDVVHGGLHRDLQQQVDCLQCQL